MVREMTSIVIILITVSMLLSLYGIVYSRSFIKKIIFFVVFSDLALSIPIVLGYNLSLYRSPPIFQDLSCPSCAKYFTDPILQAFVITALVINLSVFIFIIIVVRRLIRYGVKEVCT